MKTTLLTTFCSVALAVAAFGQTPAAPPDPAAPPPAPIATPAAPPAVAPPPVASTPLATVAPSPAAAMSPKDADDLESRIEKKVKKGVHITFGDDDEDRDAAKPGRKDRNRDRDEIHVRSSDVGDSALMAIPIVAIIFTTLFGAPVMIVAVIMFFSFWKQRQLHRTVRMMVEKGQPVPESLFYKAPTPIKLRSDMRRGIIWAMVGLGVMLFFAAVNEFEGGSWALGIIPFLIGCAYLLTWKLDVHSMNGAKSSTDNPPPLP